jgi:hypothetical protein
MLFERLDQIQRAIAARNNPQWPDSKCEKLLASPFGELWDLEYYGLSYGQSFQELIEFLSDPSVAASIRSLVFRSPDVGANGTRNWDFSRLIAANGAFSQLRSFVVEPSSPVDHNQTIIAETYDEAGQIAALVAKMPRLEELAVPSAPDSRFCMHGSQTLSYLRVDAGYDHQNFIRHLSQSTAFRRLCSLDFSDWYQAEMEEDPELCTPFSHIRQLFSSQIGTQLTSCILRNCRLSPEQRNDLATLSNGCQVMLIDAPFAEYIR